VVGFVDFSFNCCWLINQEKFRKNFLFFFGSIAKQPFFYKIQIIFFFFLWDKFSNIYFWLNIFLLKILFKNLKKVCTVHNDFYT